MKKFIIIKFILLLLAIIITSCATMLNQPKTIKLLGEKDKKILVSTPNKIYESKLPLKIKIPKKYEGNISIQTIKGEFDNTEFKTNQNISFTISPYYWLNIYNLFLFGIVDSVTGNLLIYDTPYQELYIGIQK